MAARDIPLTTTFTPPPDCLATLTFSSGNLYLGASASCLPPGAPAWGTTQKFSPAPICPSGWTAASFSSFSPLSTITAGFVTETRATCCPVLSGHFASLEDREMHGKTVDGFPFCIATIVGSYSAIADDYTDSPPLLTTIHSLTTISANSHSTNTFRAPGIQIAWQASDLVPPNRPTSSRTSTSTTVSATPEPTAEISTCPDSSNGGLSRAGKICIGILIPIIVLSAIALAFFILRRRKSKNKTPVREIQQEIMQDGLVAHSMEPFMHAKYVSPQVSYAQVAPVYPEEHESRLRSPMTSRLNFGSSPPGTPR